MASKSQPKVNEKTEQELHRLFTVFWDESKRDGALTLELDPTDEPMCDEDGCLIVTDKYGKNWRFERHAITHMLMSDLTAEEYSEFEAAAAGVKERA